MRRVVFTVEGEPLSKGMAGELHATGMAAPRFPRVTRSQLSGVIAKACDGETFAGCVAVGLVFYRSTFQRIDLDNLTKQVLDAATGAAWEDDRQVTSLTVRKRCDRSRPRTVVGLMTDTQAELAFGSTELRVAICPTCMGTFSYRPYRLQTYCSSDCAKAGTCDRCGRQYIRGSNVQRYCTDCRPVVRSAGQRRQNERRKQLRREGVVYA